MHYHGISVDDVGCGCPSAWVNPIHKVECADCDSFRYRITIPNDLIEIFTREYPTKAHVLFSVAFRVLGRALPEGLASSREPIEDTG